MEIATEWLCEAMAANNEPTASFATDMHDGAGCILFRRSLHVDVDVVGTRQFRVWIDVRLATATSCMAKLMTH